MVGYFKVTSLCHLILSEILLYMYFVFIVIILI